MKLKAANEQETASQLLLSFFFPKEKRDREQEKREICSAQEKGAKMFGPLSSPHLSMHEMQLLIRNYNKTNSLQFFVHLTMYLALIYGATYISLISSILYSKLY